MSAISQVGSWEHLEQIPTVRVTFVHATFVKGRFLGTSRNVTVTFVQATFVLATLVQIRNISALTYPILMKP